MGSEKATGNTKQKFIMLESLISALAVVTLHTNGCFWNFSSTESYWVSANAIESICYFAVPVFFMISGATNLDFFDKYSTGVFYWKRIKKTVIPYVFWSLMAMLYLLALKRLDPATINLKYIIKGLSSFNMINLYWFFGPLFATYLSMPLFAAVQKERKNQVFTWLVILTFAFNILFPFILYHGKINYSFPLSVTVGSSYFIFIMLGYLLSKNEVKIPVRLILYVMSVTGVLIHLIGTYKLSMASGEVVGTFKGYTALPSIIYAPGIFVLIKQIALKIKSEKFWKAVERLNKYTFSLYLMQWFFIYTAENYTKINTFSLVYRLGAPFVMFAIIICITFVLRKIPVVRWIVP